LKVLIAASFREKKGIPIALEALARLRREIPLEITLIGDANQEPRNQSEKQEILNAIQRGGLSGQIRLLGYVPTEVLFEEAYRHHIYLAPSITASDGDTEGGAPVALIELLASGMPVVSTNHCDIPEVLDHGAAGLMAQERDSEGLLELLRKLAAHPEDWPRLATAGRRHVEKEFDAVTQGVRLAEHYFRLTS
jgi:colanic acid/amylovoran biosynthesis glycosyltransferase